MSYIYTLVRIRQYQYFLLLNLTGKILKKLNMKHSNKVKILKSSTWDAIRQKKISGEEAMALKNPKKD